MKKKQLMLDAQKFQDRGVRYWLAYVVRGYVGQGQWEPRRKYQRLTALSDASAKRQATKEVQRLKRIEKRDPFHFKFVEAEMRAVSTRLVSRWE